MQSSTRSSHSQKDTSSYMSTIDLNVNMVEETSQRRPLQVQFQHECRYPEICSNPEWKIFRPDSGLFSVSVVAPCGAPIELTILDHLGKYYGQYLRMVLGLVDAKLITDDVKEALLQGELNIHNLTTPNMLCKQCEFKERCGGAWTAACNNPQCTKGKPHLELKYSDQKDSGVVLPCEVQDGRRFLNNLQIVKIGAGSKRSQLSPHLMRLMAISSPHSDDQPIAFGLSDEFKVPSNKSRSKEERKQSQMLRNRRHNINQQCTRQMKKQSVQNNHHPKQPSQKLKKQQNTYMPLLPFTSDDFRPNEILRQITQNQCGWQKVFKQFINSQDRSRKQKIITKSAFDAIDGHLQPSLR
eukprot:TRINITY_DN14556_c0_g1_i2.p1 TRINITY_DN14556_c0_g1~~TRINITY_DN14556_c0_g1_i2.p1  ORF type:complete len:379 (+),score=6.26 TRINITY_DN14556_c0_g1_i2:77-1138(+)